MRLYKTILLGLMALFPVLNGCTVYIPSGNLAPAPQLPPPPGALPPGQAPSLPRVVPGLMGSGLLGSPGEVTLRGAPILPGAGPFDVPPPPVPTDIPPLNPGAIAVRPVAPVPVAPPAAAPPVAIAPAPRVSGPGASLLGTDSCGPVG